MSRPIALLLLCAGFAVAQSATIQIRNAAGNGASTSDIAPGSIISVKMTAQIIRDPLPGGNSQPSATLTIRDSSGVDRPITYFVSIRRY